MENEVTIEGYGTLIFPEGMTQEEMMTIIDEQIASGALRPIVESVITPEQMERVNASNMSQSDKDYIIANGFEAFRNKAQGDFEAENQARVDARTSDISEGTQAVFPRATAEIAKGESGVGNAVLDVASLPFRAGLAGVEGGINAIGNLMYDSELPVVDTMQESLGRTEGTADMPWYEGFSESVVRDPLNIVPGAVFSKPLGALAKQGSKYVPNVVKEGVKALGSKVGIGKLDEAKEGVKQAAKASDDAINEAAKAGVIQSDNVVKNAGGNVADASDALANVSYDTWANMRHAEDANSGAIKAAQKTLDKASLKRNKIVPGVINAAKKVAPVATEEMLLEAGKQGLEGDGLDLSQIMVAGGVPIGLQTIGSGAKNISRNMLEGKLGLKPKDQDIRYAPDTDVLLDEGMVPTFGGNQGTLDNINTKMQELNNQRADIINKRDLDYIGDRAAIKDIEGDAKSYYDNMDAGGDDLFGQGLRDIAERGEVGFNKIRESHIPYTQLFNDAKAKVHRDLSYGKLNPNEAQALLDQINLNQSSLNPYTINVQRPLGKDEIAPYIAPGSPEALVPQSMQQFDEMGPVGPLSKRASAWFDKGRVNRYQPGLDPTRPESVAAEIMWDASRPYINDAPDLKEVNAEMSKYLPLQKGIEGSMGRINNKKFIANPIQNALYSNQVINAIEGVGTVDEFLKRGDLGGIMTSLYKQPFREDEEEQ